MCTFSHKPHWIAASAHRGQLPSLINHPVTLNSNALILIRMFYWCYTLEQHVKTGNVRMPLQHHLGSVTNYITLTVHFISRNSMNKLHLYFRVSPSRMHSYKDMLVEEAQDWRSGERQEGEESGGKWGNWESYGHVKQLAQWFLTAQRCVLTPPAQRPRSEVRRNRGTQVWESVRKCPEVGKFSKRNRETSHQQAGSLDWMFGGQGEG